MARSAQFFHGTTFDIPGKDVLPASRTGNSIWRDHGHHGQKSSEHAFATEDEGTAWEFAAQAGTIARSRAQLAGEKPPGRVRVHEVAAHPLMQRGVYHVDHPAFDHDGVGQDLREWRAPAFRITGTRDIMPGRQGTFPSLNWNQFGSGLHYTHDANHPMDHEITEGHEPRNGDKDALIRRMRRNGHLNTEPFGRTVSPAQQDLFTGKTVREHADEDPSEVGDYHRRNLYGSL